MPGRIRNKGVRAILKAAMEQGCAVEQRRNHYMVKLPDGAEKVVVSATPSCPRALKNARAQLRRGGVVL